MSNKNNVKKNTVVDVVDYLKNKTEVDPFKSMATALLEAVEDAQRWDNYKKTGKHITNGQMGEIIDSLKGKAA